VACDSVHEAAWLERNLLEAGTPPEWAEFARRNAELAAALIRL
jgi:hypothetical protein